MSQPEQSIEVRLAETYLESFDEDPLLNLKDIRQYSEPNFVGKNGNFYLVVCYVCPGVGDRGRENWKMNAASGVCTWCQWKYDVEIVAYIYAKMVVSGEVNMHELREMKIDYHPFRRPITMPDKRGMTLEEIKEKYPVQHEIGRRIKYEVLDEDDGYPD
jgi:hypothetical protein